MIKKLWYTYFAFYLIITSTIASVKSFFLKLKSPKLKEDYLFNEARKMSNFILKKSKTTVNISGLENIPDVPCVFISNHQAIFDGFVLVGNIDKNVGFIAKKEIEKIPLISFWFKNIKSVFIDRANIREGLKAINMGVENIKNGYSMIIFPEGTRSLSSDMGEFKKGSIKLATYSKAPIVPVTLNGTYNVLEVGKKVRGHSIDMIIHKPIYTENLSREEISNLSLTIHDTINNSLQDIRSK